MRATYWPHLAVACMLGLGACALGDDPAVNDPMDDTLAENTPANDNLAIDESAPTDSAAIDTPGHVAIPDELSFDNLSGATAEDPMDDTLAENTPTDDNLAIDESAPTDSAVIDTPGHVAIPDELSFDNLSGTTAEDNEAGISACHVKLVYCRDPDFGRLPSFCYNGCSYNHALQVAKGLCRRTCGRINCNRLVYTADC